MSVYSLASKLNSVQIEVKSKASKNNPTFTGTISSTGAISTAGNSTTTGGNIQTTSGNITTTNGSVSGGTISSTGNISAVGNITTTNGKHHNNKRVNQRHNNIINRRYKCYGQLYNNRRTYSHNKRKHYNNKR